MASGDRMTTVSFREMLKAQPFRPFLVKTADGDTFRVDHPDYALINPPETEVIIFDRDGHFRFVALPQIVSMEPVKEETRKPGKR
jgi:hypothetical protein